MTKKKAKSTASNKLTRCLHRHPSNRRCRLAISDKSSYYCDRHAHLQSPSDAPVDLSRELTANSEKFTSAKSINQFLSKLLILLSQDRITPRRGAVIAYTCNLLLRTLPALEIELHPERAKNYDRPIIWDIPGPDRHYEPDPPSTSTATETTKWPQSS
jgi:hypothetical protein